MMIYDENLLYNACEFSQATNLSISCQFFVIYLTPSQYCNEIIYVDFQTRISK